MKILLIYLSFTYQVLPGKCARTTKLSALDMPLIVSLIGTKHLFDLDQTFRVFLLKYRKKMA